MSRYRKGRARRRQPIAEAAVTLACGVFGATALAGGLTLGVAQHATVTPVGGATVHHAIVVDGRGHAVYELTGDSARHPKCAAATGCLALWPAATVRSARSVRRGGAVHGTVGVWRRGHSLQLTLAGHPLYTYAGDAAARAATGEGIRSFGGTWHVLTPNGRPMSSAPAPTSPPSGPYSYAVRAGVARAPSLSINNFAYRPGTLRVRRGTALPVANHDDTEHTVTARGGAFDLFLDSGRSGRIHLRHAGTFHYYCRIHPFMRGTIVVR